MHVLLKHMGCLNQETLPKFQHWNINHFCADKFSGSLVRASRGLVEQSDTDKQRELEETEAFAWFSKQKLMIRC